MSTYGMKYYADIDIFRIIIANYKNFKKKHKGENFQIIQGVTLKKRGHLKRSPK